VLQFPRELGGVEPLQVLHELEWDAAERGAQVVESRLQAARYLRQRLADIVGKLGRLDAAPVAPRTPAADGDGLDHGSYPLPLKTWWQIEQNESRLGRPVPNEIPHDGQYQFGSLALRAASASFPASITLTAFASYASRCSGVSAAHRVTGAPAQASA
jgi:hypothetical protein